MQLKNVLWLLILSSCSCFGQSFKTSRDKPDSVSKDTGYTYKSTYHTTNMGVPMYVPKYDPKPPVFSINSKKHGKVGVYISISPEVYGLRRN